MREVRVLFRLDLRPVENEDGSDLFVFGELFDEGSVVEQSEVSVEKEQVHLVNSNC